MNRAEFKLKYTDALVKAGLYLVSLVFGLIFALRLNIPPVVDEVGTLGNTALMMGYDWSETLYAQGACYFKYGYALLYYPLMLIFKDSYIFYKACLVLNVIINSFIPVIAYQILHKHLHRNRLSSAFLSITAVCLPSTLLYTLYTKADSVLIFLPWAILLTILELAALNRSKQNRIKRILLSALLAFLGVYSYMAHTRGIVNYLAIVVAAVIISILLKYCFINIPSFVVSSAVWFFLDSRLSDYFKGSLFGVYGTKYSSVESYDFEALKKIFTHDGIFCFIKDFVGTAYNVLASTWGLAAIFFFGGLILVIKYIRHKSSASPEEVVSCVFTWICFAGTFCMSIIYFFPYVYEYLLGTDAHRADWLVYGRYAACATGPVVLMALHLISRPEPAGAAVSGESSTQKPNYGMFITRMLSILFFAGVIMIFGRKCLGHIEGVSAVSRNFIQLCTFLEVGSYGITTAVFDNLGTALIYAGLLGFAGMIVINVLSWFRKKNSQAVTVAASVIFIAAGITLIFVNYNKIRISRDEILMKWTKESTDVLEEVRELAGEYPVLVDSSAKSIKHYQFVCKEFTVGSNLTAVANSDNMFIIAKKKYFLKDYYDDDYYTFDCFNYDEATKDIVYVKGEKLAEELRRMGYRLTKYKGKFKKSPAASVGI